MANNSTDVGINLAATNYWGTEYPFINRIKDSGSWLIYYKDGSKGYASADQLDANGNLSTLPDNAKSAGLAFSYDPIGLETTDRYVLTYDGTAKVQIAGAKIISSTNGKIVFEMTKDAGWTSLTVTSADHLSNMAIVREDLVPLYQAGEIFNPAFVDKIDDFSTLRFMDWGATNNSTLSNWADRPQVDHRSWQGSEGGVPIEIMVALANKTHNDMWINIPFGATDDFVRQEMTYIRDNLDPSLKVKVEYSNEVWNFGFSQAKQAMVIADQMWGVDANKDGKIDVDDPKEHVADGWRQYYGYRAAQVASIANSVFTDDQQGRLENVLSARGTNGTTISIANGVAKADVGSISSLFDVLSMDGYFGNFGGGKADDLQKVLDWAKGGAAGLDAAFAELATGGALDSDMSVQAIIAKFATYTIMAHNYGLDLVVYEGGVALASDDYSTADRPIIADFYKRLSDDPRMGELYTKLVKGFEAVGGTEFVAFNDASRPSIYGTWGALESIYQDGSVRYDTLLALAQAGALGAVSDPADTLGGTSDGLRKLTGTAAADTLKGTDGRDLIDGRAGNDVMIGGAGDDIYIVDSVGDRVVERADEGRDVIRTTLAAYNLSTVVNVESLVFTGTGDFRGTGSAGADTIVGGAGNDTLAGAAGNDILYGKDGNDTIDGGLGADRMIGGKGDDIYVVDNAKDVIVELTGEGTDTVRTSVSYSIVGTAVERMDATGTGAITLTGNELDNTLRGNDAVNIIAGGSGDDLIRGYGGNDTLKGEDGNDALYGGDGNDILIGGAGKDTMRGEAGADIFKFLALGDMSKVAAGADIIADMEIIDKIDLSAIDANTTLAGDQAFKFIGTAAFSGAAGELHMERGPSYWLVSGDINGDKVADFAISVAPMITLTANNFIL